MAVRTCLLWVVPLALATLGSGLAACAESAPIPGYENVGGADGTGGTGNGNGSTTSSSSTTGSTTGSSTTSSTSSSTSSTTSSTSTTTGGGTTSSTGLMCADTGPGEPNETESTAHNLGTIGDADGDGGTLTAMLAGVNDKDWYKYTGQDNFGSTVDPTRTVSAGDAVRVCKYAQCTTGDEDFACPAGTTSATSPDGRPGCCGSSGFSLNLNCTGTSSDDATIYVRIDTQVNDCVSYTFAWHY